MNIADWLSQEAEEEKTCDNCKNIGKYITADYIPPFTDDAIIEGLKEKEVDVEECKNCLNCSHHYYSYGGVSYCDNSKVLNKQKALHNGCCKLWESEKKSTHLITPDDENTRKEIGYIIPILHSMTARIDKFEQKINHYKWDINNIYTALDKSRYSQDAGLRKTGKSADEMFEELEYRKTEDGKYYVVYTGACSKVVIDKGNLTYLFRDLFSKEGLYINEDLSEAIHKKIEEMKNDI